MFGFTLRSGRMRPDFFFRPKCKRLVVSAAMIAMGIMGTTATARASEPLAPSTAPPIQDASSAQLPRMALKIGDRRVIVEVAADDASRSRGLMFRARLSADHGMLFVFPEAAQLCFWMKNTPLPLSIAFIDAQGQIVSLSDMQPHSLDTHCAIAPALYALEMTQGWFAQHGARPGTLVHGLPHSAVRPAR